MGIDPEVIRLASRQGGFVTRQQLIGLGESRSAIDRRIRAGALDAVVAGVYRVIPSDHHVDVLRGALLTLPDAVVSHQSAAVLLDFPILPALVPTVLVHRRTTHTFPGVTVRRCDDLQPEHITVVAGMQVTTIVRTVFDLAALIAPDAFEKVAEALLIDGRLKIHHLERTSRDLSRRGKPGSALVRDFLATRSHGQVVAPTVLENRGRAVLGEHGLPQPIAQFPIPWDPLRRFDDAYPEARAAIEWDSARWHTQRDAMRSDRRRDREAVLHGWVLLRFTWADITEEPERVAATVAGVLAARTLP